MLLVLAERIAVLFLEECKMKPKPFKPEIYNNDERYVRDLTTGLIWHRSNRTFMSILIVQQWFTMLIICVILSLAARLLCATPHIHIGKSRKAAMSTRF